MYRHEDYLKAVEEISAGRIRLAPLVSNRFPLEKYRGGLRIHRRQPRNLYEGADRSGRWESLRSSVSESCCGTCCRPGGGSAGAPVNFAFYAQEQGAEACIVSAVGQDASGDELLGGIAALGLGVRAVQRNAHPTSTVEVTLDAAGIPAYRIREQVAWDYIERTAEADAAVAGAAVVCWGSLAQRNAVSRRTILALVDAAPVGCLRLFDINLRLNYYDERIVRDSLERPTS